MPRLVHRRRARNTGRQVLHIALPQDRGRGGLPETEREGLEEDRWRARPPAPGAHAWNGTTRTSPAEPSAHERRDANPFATEGRDLKRPREVADRTWPPSRRRVA